MTQSEINIRIRAYRQFYKDLKKESLLPYILHLKNEVRISEGDLYLVCDILESYIVRRMVEYGKGIYDDDQNSI